MTRYHGSNYYFDKSMTKDQIEKLLASLQGDQAFNILNETAKTKALQTFHEELAGHLLEDICNTIIRQDLKKKKSPTLPSQRKRRTRGEIAAAKKAQAAEEAQLAAEEAAEDKSE